MLFGSATGLVHPNFSRVTPGLSNNHYSHGRSVATRRNLSVGNIGSVAKAAYQAGGVQKVLELGVIVGAGASLREKLDAKAVTSLLLNALVPPLIISSLSSLSISADMGYVLLSGVFLILLQIASGELASRIVIDKGDDLADRATLRRTAAMQLGTMAPALSVLSFTREFVGPEYAGLAALADLPTKIYGLLLLPYYLRFRGTPKGDTTTEALVKTKKAPRWKRFLGAFKDPFNLAIASGLTLAALGRPVSSLGFLGKAVGSLAEAQTAILFLLIGLKLKFGGARAMLCLRLLLARHGFVGLATSAFLAAFVSPTDVATRLAIVLSSNAACSIIGFGQIAKVADEMDGYDTDLALDLMGLSFPLTIVLNTVACLAGNRYVQALPAIGTSFLATSVGLGMLISHDKLKGNEN
jgi:hypothetical protein